MQLTLHNPIISPFRLRRRLLATGLLLAMILLLSSCSLPTLRNREPDLPVSMSELLPKDWKPLDDIHLVSIDGDPENEYLIFFNYDNPVGRKGPVGGIVYDAQFNTDRYDGENSRPFPFQPSTILVPYRLLPDWAAAKGQGYLAQKTVEWEKLASPVADETELIVYGDGSVKSRQGTRISIFWWTDEQTGYRVQHFVGSHHVKATFQAGINESLGTITQITESDRLYERSNLCQERLHTRKNNSHEFSAGPFRVVFCDGVPQEPTYPEAVVLAWLSGSYHYQEGEERLLLERVRPELKATLNTLVPRKPDRITMLQYTGEVKRQGVGSGAESTIKVVITSLEGTSGPQNLQWELSETRPQFITDTTRWRIENVIPVALP